MSGAATRPDPPPDNLEGERPDDAEPEIVPQEIFAIKILDQIEASSTTNPGGAMNRAWVLILAVGISLLAGWVVAKICEIGEVSGGLTTGLSLGTLLLVAVVGLVFVSLGFRTQPKRRERKPAGEAGGQPSGAGHPRWPPATVRDDRNR